MKRSLAVFVLIVSALLLLGAVPARHKKHPSHTQVAPVPPGFIPWPNHIEWSEFTVPDGGMKLCRPTGPPDSLGSIPLGCIDLPPGTEVYVPRLVPGESPESMQQRKQHMAWR